MKSLAKVINQCSDIKVCCRYEDDKDEGEWFLYTGSGGRDLSGNKRVNKVSLEAGRLCDKSLLVLPTSCHPLEEAAL